MPRPIEDTTTNHTIASSLPMEEASGLQVLNRLGLFTDVEIDRSNPRHQAVIRQLLDRIIELETRIGELLMQQLTPESSQRRILIHDVRGFITVIIYNLQLLLEEEELTTQALILDVMSAVAQLTARTTLSPTNSWEAVRENLRNTCPIQFEIQGYELLTQTRLTPEDFSTIVMNASLNSKKNGAKAAWIHISETSSGVTINIIDNGPGFLCDDNSLRLLARSGFGLSGNGLAYINQLVEKIGGRLRLSDHPDEEYGAVLTLALPKKL